MGDRLHLAESSKAVSPGGIALLVLDGAGWHTSPKLVLPDNIILLRTPPLGAALLTFGLDGMLRS